MSVILLSSISIVLIIFAIYFSLSKQVLENKDTNASESSKNVSMEASVISKNDKDFYKVSVKKNLKPLDKKTINSMLKYVNKIKKFLDMKTVDMGKLDKTMHAFLMDKEIARIDKIQTIWNMLDEIGFESEQSKYLLDSLSTLLPIELTQELINVYGDIKDPSVKIRFVDMLADNIGILNPEIQDKERLDFITNKIQDIRQFLKEDVLNEKDSQIAETGLYAYANISDEEDVQELIATLKSKEDKGAISKEVFTDVLTETAMSTSESQEEMLPALLENIKNTEAMSPQEKERFTEKMLDGLAAGVLSQNAQQELSTYMKEQEPRLNVSKATTTQSISKYYTWAEGVSKIKENRVTLENIALESDNPLKVSSILLYADDTTIQKIKENPNVESMQAKLEAKLEDDNIAQETKTIIKDAMGRLSENTLK